MSRVLLSKILTGAMLADARLSIPPREGEEMQVFVHPCGKREAIAANAIKQPCPDCNAMFSVFA